MLKQDFNGYKEFLEKLKNTSREENLKACIERVQMWSDKFMNIISPLPRGDIAHVIVALETIAKTLRKDSMEARVLADALEMVIGTEVTTTTVKGDMYATEADVRAYVETLKKK